MSLLDLLLCKTPANTVSTSMMLFRKKFEATEAVFTYEHWERRNREDFTSGRNCPAMKYVGGSIMMWGRLMQEQLVHFKEEVVS